MSLWKVGDDKIMYHHDSCALAGPNGPWHLSFAPGRLENLSFFFHRNHIIGTVRNTGLKHWACFSFS